CGRDRRTDRGQIRCGCAQELGRHVQIRHRCSLSSIRQTAENERSAGAATAGETLGEQPMKHGPPRNDLVARGTIDMLWSRSPRIEGPGDADAKGWNG